MKNKILKIWQFILEAIGFYFIVVTLANTFFANTNEAFLIANIITLFVGICIIYYYLKERKK